MRRLYYSAAGLLVAIGSCVGIGQSRAAAAMQGSSSRPGLTSQGHLFWNLEALLKTTFGAKKLATDASRRGYVDFVGCGKTGCAPLARYDPYWYTFSDPVGSAFHVSDQRFKSWSFGNYPEPVLIDGKIVACDPKEHSFLIHYADASSFSLACLSRLPST